MYKTGTGTRGRGHWDACVGTWDSGTRDEGLGDINYGTQGRVGRGRGMSNTGMRGTQDVTDYCDKCDFSHFPREYVLAKATHPTLLTVPPCLFTKQRLSEDPSALKKVKPLSWSSC